MKPETMLALLTQALPWGAGVAAALLLAGLYAHWRYRHTTTRPHNDRGDHRWP